MSKKRARTVDLAPPEQPNHGLKFHYELRNEWQRELWDLIHQQDNRIIFIEGSAGSGKTWIATAAACNAYLSKRTRKIHLCRPYVTAFEQYGYLKGDLNEKLQPMLLPILDIIDGMTHGGPDKKKLEEALVYEGMGFLRGRTFNNWVIADEQQNSTFEQLKLLVTRVGKFCKMIITYDPTQIDNPNSGIRNFVKYIEDVPGVIVYRLPPEAQVREPIVQRILNALPVNLRD